MSNPSNMYADARTWNPFKGCGFACSYCVPSFQRQAKRQKQNCRLCYRFTPHCHPERLEKIPSAEIVFVCGNGDISFSPLAFTREILGSIREHSRRCPEKQYYLQSKRPAYFEQFVDELPDNVLLVTTLETNRDAGYSSVSKAPPPSERYEQFLKLKHPRKVVTIEPIMDFDPDVFARWIIGIVPEYVWLGFNSRPQQVSIPEPPVEKVAALVKAFGHAGVPVRTKDVRGQEELFSGKSQG